MNERGRREAPFLLKRFRVKQTRQHEKPEPDSDYTGIGLSLLEMN
jgi:hypothetical protein